MLISIKKSSFKISVPQKAQELGIRESINGLELEISARETCWIFRYDCI